MSEPTRVISWERSLDEPPRWFTRFDKYAKPLGREFSVYRAYLMYRADMAALGNKDALDEDAMDLWRETAAIWHWAERSAAWSDAETYVRMMEWEKRRRQLMDDDWAVGDNLRKFAQKVLDYFEISQEGGEDEEGHKVVMGTVTASQLTQLMTTASNLQRLGIGEPTEITARAEKVGPQIYLPIVNDDKKEKQE